MKLTKTKLLKYFLVSMLWLSFHTITQAQLQVRYNNNIRVVNMIPFNQSGETWQDSEPNIAVDPSNTNRIIGSAFTINPTGNTNAAPIYTSTNGGNTWNLNNIVPSANGMTGDITIKFSENGNRLYTGILRGGGGLRMVVLRSNNPFGNTMMQPLMDHSTEQLDQPYVKVITTQGPNRDRVFVGFNNLDNFGGQGRTAEIEYSNNAANAPPPAGLTRAVIESRNTFAQDMPAIRPAMHDDGTVYAVFYSWQSGNTPNAMCDVVVVRDDNFGTGASPYTALVDAGDGNPGNRVVQNRLVPAFPASLGANRLVASNLSIAVDPNNSSNVYIAWADRVGANDYTLHVRRSTDRGVTWSNDLLTITNATNPALAINFRGVVGFLYQRLNGGNWETHMRRSTNNGLTWGDQILSNTPDNTPAPTFQPYIGDYIDLMNVGLDFYGIFSASNVPDNNNFPQGVTYQRNANFTTNQLLDNSNNVIGPSIDPFFFEMDEFLVLTCPTDIAENSSPGDCGATVNYPAPLPGAIPTGITITYNPPSGSFFPVGSTNVTVTASDAIGNSETCTFVVSITDNEPPSITCPADTPASCEATDPSVTGNPIVSDNCGLGPVNFSDSITEGICPGNYIIERTWTVSDINGLSSSCTQVITVTDEIAPIITCPDDITVTCDTTTAATGVATSIDNCDPDPVETYSDVVTSGDCDWLCQIQRTWTSTDFCDNTSTCNQIITKDVTPLVEAALKSDVDGDGVQDDLVLGTTQTTLTITVADAACIVQWMPASGSTPTALKRENAVVAAGCTPGTNPRDIDGKIENPLLGIVLELELYARLDPSFLDIPLSNFDCEIAQIVMQTVRRENNQDPQMRHLLRVANLALGNLVLVPHLQELLDALECIGDPIDLCDAIDTI